MRAALNLEFGHRLRLLDLDGLGILPSGFQEEILDLGDLLGHLEDFGSVSLTVADHSPSEVAQAS